MRAPFPPWSNTAVRLGLFALFVLVVGGSCLLMLYVRTPWVTDVGNEVAQPVLFDHRHHVGDDGIDCRYCHDQVEKAASAGMPPVSLCMNCHSQIWTASPLLNEVRDTYFTGRPLEWKRVHRLPDHVYFNHSIHVNKGVGCTECHGRIDSMPEVHKEAPLTMGWCLDCHRDPAPHLRPREEVTSFMWKPPAGAAHYHQDLAQAYGVRSLVHCSTCHR